EAGDDLDRHGAGLEVDLEQDAVDGRDQQVFLAGAPDDVDVVRAGLEDILQRAEFFASGGEDTQPDEVVDVVLVLPQGGEVGFLDLDEGAAQAVGCVRP